MFFCTNYPSLINSCYPLPGIGDHEIVAINSFLSVHLDPPSKKNIVFMYGLEQISYIYNRLSKTSALKFLSNYTHHNDINVLWDLNIFPSKETTTRNRQPWITQNIRRLSLKKHT